MKILVTGASGYVGNKLAHTLANRGYEVHALIRSEEAKQYLVHPCIQVFKGDILDKKSLTAAMKNCSQVYHTAALVKLWAKNRDEFYEHNVGGTINVLEMALENDVMKLVYTSSGGVWGESVHHALTENDPRISSFNNDYDLSKHLAEHSVRDYSNKGLCAVIVNPSRIYGPGLDRYSSAVNRLIKRILDHKFSFLPWRLETTANYVYVDDVVNGHILAMEKGIDGERYILGGHNISYRQLAGAVHSFTNRKKYLIGIPGCILKSWGYYELGKAKILQSEPLVTPSLLHRFSLDKTFDCSKAEKQISYTITPFEESIKNTIKFLNKDDYGK